MTNVKRHLTQLQAAGLIRLVQNHPELEFMFRHALIREAAYRSLLRADRKKLHRQVAEAIEQTYPDQVASRELAPVLADHFAKAGDDQQALKYFTLAGDADAAVYANAEAAKYYTHALEIARRTETNSEKLTYLFTSLGRTLELDSQYDQALTTYKEIEKLAQERDDRPLELAALIPKVRLYATPTPLHDSGRGKTLGKQALALARELGDSAAEAKLLWILSIAYTWTHEMAQAIDYGERSLALARALNLREQMAFTLNDLGFNCYATIAHFDQAKAALREASGLWRELGNLPMLTDSLTASCNIHVETGEYDQALALSEEAFQLSQSIGNLWGQSYSQMQVGRAYWQRGQPDRAITVMEESLRLSELSGFFPPQILTRANLATIFGGLGAIEPGLETAHHALAMAQAHMLLFQPYALGILAQLQLLNGNLAEAEVAIDQGKKDPTGEAWPVYSMSVRFADGEFVLRQGDFEQAIAVTNTLLTDWRQFGAFVPKALYLQAQALLGLGQVEEARDRLREARTEAEAIGTRWMLWQILATLAEIEDDPTEAEMLRHQAQEIIEYIADHTPTPELRTSFLNLPEVRAVLDE